jgi:hypothetical protein
MTDDTLTISTCADCGESFEDETNNLHEYCGVCEPLHEDDED